MSGGGTTTATSGKSDPWAGAQPYLGDVMSNASAMYQSGAGSHPYQGQFVAGTDPTLAAAMQGMVGTANNTAGAAGQPFNVANNLIANNGLTSRMEQPLAGLGQIGSGANGLSGDLYSQLYGQAGAQNILPGDTLRAVAGGNNQINTGGLYGQLYGQAGNQNAGAAATLGGLSNGQPISTAGMYGDLAAGAPGNNAGVINALSQFALGGGVPSTDALQQLYGQSQGAMSPFVQGLSNPGQINTGRMYGSVYGAAGGPSAAQSNLSGISAGDDVNNPYLQDMLAANDRRISDRVNSTMSGMGRYGSAGHTDVLARSLAESDNPILAQAYESARGRQLQATGQIDAARQAGYGTQLAAAQGQTGVQGQNIANRMSGLGQAANITQGGLGMQSNILGQIAGAQNAAVGNQLNAAGQIAGLNNQNFSNQLAALGGMTGAQGQGAGINLQAANALGSLNQGDMAQQLAAAQGLTGIQQQNIGNRMSAANSLGAMNQGNTAQQLAAAQGLTGVQQQNIGNQMGANTAQLGALGQGLNTAGNFAQMSPSLYGMQYSPYQQMATAGQFNQGQTQQELSAQIALQNQMNQMPWTQLGNYSAGISGLAGLIPQTGATSGYQNAQQQTPWTQLAGLGIAGLGLL